MCLCNVTAVTYGLCGRRSGPEGKGIFGGSRNQLESGREAKMALFNPLHIFAAAFIIAGLGGVAALLRSARKLNGRAAAGAVLSSGLLGLTIALLWYNHFEGTQNIYFLLGLCGLTGLGGVTAVDILLKMAKKGGLHIVITAGDGKPKK